jgi:hypothetical protein
MKTTSPNSSHNLETLLKRTSHLLAGLFLTVWALAPRASAQAPPRIDLQFSAGQPTLSLSGAAGTVYSIQYAADLSSSKVVWVDRTLVQAKASGTVWADPSAPTPGQRFYRAISVPTPADTNLVFIQPGTFMMGSPTKEALRNSDETQHTVTISQGFWMEKYLVTQGDYVAVVGSNPSLFTSANGHSDDFTRPVETVSWIDASNYCALRTQQERAGGADSRQLCVSVADGIGVGVCLPSGNDDGVLSGERFALGTGELQRLLRVRCRGGRDN